MSALYRQKISELSENIRTRTPEKPTIRPHIPTPYSSPAAVIVAEQGLQKVVDIAAYMCEYIRVGGRVPKTISRVAPKVLKNWSANQFQIQSEKLWPFAKKDLTYSENVL